MVSVIWVNVDVIQAGLGLVVSNFLATQDAKNMVNVGMELVYVHKDGMDVIVLYVRQ